MSFEVKQFNAPGFEGETYVAFSQDRETLTIHPWTRDVGNEVYIDFVDDRDVTVFSRIFDRDEFVSVILAVFPELRRAE